MSFFWCCGGGHANPCVDVVEPGTVTAVDTSATSDQLTPIEPSISYVSGLTGALATASQSVKPFSAVANWANRNGVAAARTRQRPHEHGTRLAVGNGARLRNADDRCNDIANGEADRIESAILTIRGVTMFDQFSPFPWQGRTYDVMLYFGKLPGELSASMNSGFFGTSGGEVVVPDLPGRQNYEVELDITDAVKAFVNGAYGSGLVSTAARFGMIVFVRPQWSQRSEPHPFGGRRYEEPFEIAGEFTQIFNS